MRLAAALPASAAAMARAMAADYRNRCERRESREEIMI
jgi:hypothetical protein